MSHGKRPQPSAETATNDQLVNLKPVTVEREDGFRFTFLVPDDPSLTEEQQAARTEDLAPVFAAAAENLDQAYVDDLAEQFRRVGIFDRMERNIRTILRRQLDVDVVLISNDPNEPLPDAQAIKHSARQKLGELIDATIHQALDNPGLQHQVAEASVLHSEAWATLEVRANATPDEIETLSDDEFDSRFQAVWTSESFQNDVCKRCFRFFEQDLAVGIADALSVDDELDKALAKVAARAVERMKATPSTALRATSRRNNRKITRPWPDGTLFPTPNLQNNGTRNLANALSGGVAWTIGQSGAAELLAVRGGQPICRIDLTPGTEAAERALLEALGPRAIKTMVATSRLIYEKTNRAPINRGTTLSVAEVARAMGYEPGPNRTIKPEILQHIGADLRALSKIMTYAADGPWDPKRKSRPSSWVAPLIVVGAVHVTQEGPDGTLLPYEFDVMLGRNWAQAFAQTDLLQVAPNFMELDEPNTIRLAWFYLTEFRYAMTKAKAGLSRKIPALCDAAGIDPGTATHRGRFLVRLEGWHGELQKQGVIGFYRRTPGLDTDRSPSEIFAEAEYLVRPPQSILDVYSAPREKALERPKRRARKTPG